MKRKGNFYHPDYSKKQAITDSFSLSNEASIGEDIKKDFCFICHTFLFNEQDKRTFVKNKKKQIICIKCHNDLIKKKKREERI